MVKVVLLPQYFKLSVLLTILFPVAVSRFSIRTPYPYRTFETKLLYVAPQSTHFKSFPFLLPFSYPCSKTYRTLQYPLIALFAPWYRNLTGYGVRTVLRSNGFFLLNLHFF